MSESFPLGGTRDATTTYHSCFECDCQGQLSHDGFRLKDGFKGLESSLFDDGKVVYDENGSSAETTCNIVNKFGGFEILRKSECFVSSFTYSSIARCTNSTRGSVLSLPCDFIVNIVIGVWELSRVFGMGFLLEPVSVGILFCRETTHSRRHRRPHPPMMYSLAHKVDTIQRSEEQDVTGPDASSEHFRSLFGR